MKKPKTIRAVLFDYDGVIANTIEANFLSWRHVFLQLKVSLTRKEFLSFEGMRPLELAQAVCQRYGLPQERAQGIISEKEDYFITHYTPPIYSGVEDLLRGLRKSGIKLGLVSVGNKVRIYNTTPKHIISQFDAVVTGDEIEKPKPDPEPYVKILSKLRVSSNNVVVIEDSSLGIESAKAVGMYCIAVASTRDKRLLQEADIIVDNMFEVNRILQKIL
jgi:beta-phosphoglucomutase